MVEINLLPWRENKRRYQIHKIKIMLGLSVLFMALVLGSLHFFLSVKERELTLHINALQGKIKHFERASLHKPVIHAATRSSFSLAQLLAELNRTKDHAVCLTHFLYTNKVATFMGKTRSAADLTEYLKQWPAAHLFSQINLNQFEQKETAFMRFQFEAIRDEK